MEPAIVVLLIIVEVTLIVITGIISGGIADAKREIVAMIESRTAFEVTVEWFCRPCHLALHEHEAHAPT